MKKENYILVMRKCGEGYYWKNNIEHIYQIGHEYHIEEGIFVYRKAVDTLKEHPCPYAKKYLEVSILSDIKENESQLTVYDFKIIRELSLEELRVERKFNNACIMNKNVIESNHEKFMREIQDMRVERERKTRITRYRFKLATLAVVALWTIVIIFYIVIPVLCVKFGLS